MDNNAKITDIYNSLADAANKMGELLNDRTAPQTIKDKIIPIKASIQVAAAKLDEIQQNQN